MKKNTHHTISPWRLILLFACCVAWNAPTPAYADPTTEAFDAALSPYFKPDKPGATIIVTRNGNTIFRKAYGMADLERNISLQPDMVFRLGSLTKQFTAVAVMMLADEGKLAVTDEITRFLPEYPTHGKKITIENLLTHTSGIKNYTEMAKFADNRSADMTHQQMIDLFKDEPLEFEPGDRFSYSNSGYFLLGAIIEQVSKMSYSSFTARYIFEPLGMTRTAYEGYERTDAKRVEGYSGKNRVLPISMTRPYAAGALISTVDDLAIWDAAISSKKLLRPESWEQVFTAHKLKSGAATNYGYGWFIDRFKGYETASHGGDIDGFSAYAMRLPTDNLYIAILTNSDGRSTNTFASLFRNARPEVLVQKLTAIAIGH